MDKTAVFKLSYGLYVLTSAENGKDNGCIVNTAAQLASEPLLISVTVNKSNLTHDMIKNTGIFNISVIGRSADFSLFKHFGFSSGRNAEKFGTPESHVFMPAYSDNGLLYVKKGTNAFISCKVKSMTDLGSHTMFIGEMTDGKTLSDDPSMTYADYHANVKPKPTKTEKKGWICKICGYIYEGEELPDDFICPICKHGASDFEKL
ncbi:MAG: flavin reductase [Ruminococcus sp.]|nr:flavin reductase [Ruminococcus sp.]